MCTWMKQRETRNCQFFFYPCGQLEKRHWEGDRGKKPADRIDSSFMFSATSSSNEVVCAGRGEAKQSMSES